MSRRIVPGLFWVGMALCSALVATGAGASSPPDGVTDVRGHWDGFFLGADAAAQLGQVQSDITVQDHRRVEGQGTLLDLDGRTLFNAYNFTAAAAEGVIAGTGPSTTGRVVIHGGVETFAGAEGDAGIWEPDLLFVPARGRQNAISAIFLHPFPDRAAPDIGDIDGAGGFHGLTDPSLQGTGFTTFAPRERGSVPGSFTFIPDPGSNVQTAFSWPVRATTSADNQFVMIGQGQTGRMSYVGAVFTKNGSPTEIWGIARLSLIDGRVLFNAYNFSVIIR